MLAALVSPMTRIVVAVVAAIAFVVAVYTAGYRAHVSVSREQQYQAERDAALRDLRVAKAAAKEAEELAAAAETEAAEAKARADEYAKSLPKTGDAVLTDADIRRLRDIRNRKKR